VIKWTQEIWWKTWRKTT